MASLPSKKFEFKNNAGDVLKFTSPVSVDSEGTFSMVIPDELEEVARSVVRGKDHTVWVSQPRNTIRVYAKSLDTCKDYIAKICNEYLTCETTIEKVILYTTDIKVAYCKDEKGFYPNGNIAGKGYCWYGKVNEPHTEKYYSIGLGARAYRKKTFKRVLSTKVIYDWINTDYKNKGTYLELLNGFAGLRMNTQSCKEIPYTEEAAEFFYETMLSMCKLADRLDTFFSDDENIIKAINNQSSFLQITTQ